MESYCGEELHRIANLTNNFNVLQRQHESFPRFLPIVSMGENVAKLRVGILMNAPLCANAEVAPARDRTLKLDTFDPQLEPSAQILCIRSKECA